MSVENYSKLVLRAFHATPSTVVLRPSPSPSNSTNRYPNAADVRVGVVFGPGQFRQQEYITGIGIGTKVYSFVG